MSRLLPLFPLARAERIGLYCSALALVVSWQAAQWVIASVVDPAGLAGVVSATNQFEYSFSTETEREIVENWLDVSYLFGSFRTGILLNSQAPSEERNRGHQIRHRFFEFKSGPFDLRVGHFYGLFGRGLVFSAYEDRIIRVDTALDGIITTTHLGRFRGTIFSGTPSALDRDVRGFDAELDLGDGLSLGGTALTYQTPTPAREDDSVNREWVTSGRLMKFFSFGDVFFEYGWKKGYDFEAAIDNEAQNGHAFYGSVNLYLGPFGLAVEGKDYHRFAVLRNADGRVPLNNPPALTREHMFTLLSRNTHNLDSDDEVGTQAELTYSGPGGLTLVANANRTERNDGTLLFEEAYAQLEKERLGAFRLRGAFGYQDLTIEKRGLHQTAIADLTWIWDDRRSLTLQAEHQHVRLSSVKQPTGILNRGTFDQQHFTLELAFAPHWTLAGILEVNNKRLPEQALFEDEPEGPFPALTLSYATGGGGLFSLWAGKRQAGQLCTGGICKPEPAFEGVEVVGVFRY
jgi:hypothetical protein